jgi:hypothetical protein
MRVCDLARDVLALLAWRLMKWITVAAGLVVMTSVACGGDETGSSSGGTGASAGTGGNGSGAAGGTGGSGGMPDLSLQGASCPSEGCPAPLDCVTYCGFAGCGGNGSSLSTCEIPCSLANGNTDCPAGQSCFSVSDGPGEVCQPS